MQRFILLAGDFLSRLVNWVIITVNEGLLHANNSSNVDRARGRKNVRALYQFDWYKDFKRQYKNNWDRHPEIIEFMSYVELDDLQTDAGRQAFLEKLKVQLDVLKWQ